MNRGSFRVVILRQLSLVHHQRHHFSLFYSYWYFQPTLLGMASIFQRWFDVFNLRCSVFSRQLKWTSPHICSVLIETAFCLNLMTAESSFLEIAMTLLSLKSRVTFFQRTPLSERRGLVICRSGFRAATTAPRPWEGASAGPTGGGNTNTCSQDTPVSPLPFRWNARATGYFFVI